MTTPQNPLLFKQAESSGAEYIARINRVTDYIETHLSESLSLEKIAGIAHFSPFHFHRVFKAITGETLNRFIQRLRLEKAATQLLHSKEKPVTDIAMDIGFSSASTFARAFKQMFGMSAMEWREGGDNSKKSKELRNNDHVVSNGWKAKPCTVRYIGGNLNLKWRVDMNTGKSFDVNVNDLDEMTVAYVRYTGPYQGDVDTFESLYTKLFKWAIPRGFCNQPDVKMLSVYHDNPEITEADKLRVSVCITVPPDIRVSGEIGKMTIPGGAYAMGRFELKEDQYAASWDAMMGGWLPESGYQPDDRPCFEIAHNDPREHPEGLHIIDICIPVKTL